MYTCWFSASRNSSTGDWTKIFPCGGCADIHHDSQERVDATRWLPNRVCSEPGSQAALCDRTTEPTQFSPCDKTQPSLHKMWFSSTFVVFLSFHSELALLGLLVHIDTLHAVWPKHLAQWQAESASRLSLSRLSKISTRLSTSASPSGRLQQIFNEFSQNYTYCPTSSQIYNLCMRNVHFPKVARLRQNNVSASSEMTSANYQASVRISNENCTLIRDSPVHVLVCKLCFLRRRLQCLEVNLTVRRVRCNYCNLVIYC